MRNTELFSYSQNSYKGFLSYINNKRYLFRATLFNPDNIVVEFYKSAIKELYINDNLLNPFLNGYIVIDNREDVIERYVSDPTQLEFYPNAELVRGYRTRGDARDILFLTIIPIVEGVEPYDESSTAFNQEFGLQYVFVLGNETNIFNENGKLKKYDIQDYDFQILSEKKLFFSTTQLLPNKKDIANLSNDDREVETGKIMKKILQDGLNDTQSVFTVLSGGEQITPKFEDGISKIFYTSPAENTALDDLLYVYDFHVSNSPERDFAILKKENFTGEYFLESMSSIFSKAYNRIIDTGGPYYLENLTITGGQTINNVLVNDVRKPLQAIEFGETGDAIDVKFFNSPGSLYQEKVRTRLIHSYDNTGKNFLINCKDGNIENVKNDFTQFYVKPMKGKNNSPAPNLIVNNTQKTNLNYENDFMIYTNHSDFIQLSMGRNTVLKNALLLNLGVEITVQGSLHRKTGRFISIDRRGTYIDNDFDDKFLGLYFVLNVEHSFTNDQRYLNKIIAIKTYVYKDLKNNENVT